jgi:hypothetical protein
VNADNVYVSNSIFGNNTIKNLYVTGDVGVTTFLSTLSGNLVVQGRLKSIAPTFTVFTVNGNVTNDGSL